MLRKLLLKAMSKRRMVVVQKAKALSSVKASKFQKATALLLVNASTFVRALPIGRASTFGTLSTFVAALAFVLASPFVAASPFVNVSLHPDLAALRPVVSPEPQPAAHISQPPELVLSFVPPPAPAGANGKQIVYTDVWERIRAGFGVKDLQIKEMSEAQTWYARHPELVANILQRSRYYLFHIVDEVEKRGMPTEIALLPFIESGFDPRAFSSSQALGLWQFIPETGTKYNLDQNPMYDARRDIIASTTAALDYLQFLHDMFGDWQIALAAYNWGEKSIGLAIERNRARGLATDFASLSLPAETRNYLPKLLAVKQLVMAPQRFGVTLPRVDNEPYFVMVAMPDGVDLKQAARLADMENGEFELLNAAYIQPHPYTQPHPNALPMRAVIRVDKFTGFLDRVREFIQKKEFLHASQPAKRPKSPSAAASCCKRR